MNLSIRSLIRGDVMNRAERRARKKQGLPVKKEPVINVKSSDISAIKMKLVSMTSLTQVSS